MADESKGSYTYPDTPGDPDRTGVLRNKFGLTRHSELGPADYAMTHIRQSEIAEGRGPSGNFDKEHLKAIHGYIFQDVYEWAGHTRNESPIVDGQRLEPIGSLSKGSTSFLHGSRIDFGLDEAFKPIRDPNVLRTATPEQFAERAGQVDRADLPERLPDDNTEVSFTARSDFSRLGREQQATEAHMRPQQAEPQRDRSAGLKAIEAEMEARRDRERDEDDRGR